MSMAEKIPSWRGSRRRRPRRRRDICRFRQLVCEQFESRCLLATVTLNPVADNTLYEDPAGSLSNGAGTASYVGQAGSRAGIRRALVKFDLAGQVPQGSHIDSVSLRLNMSKTRTNTQRTVEVHLVSADWGEGTSNASTGGLGGGQGDGVQATMNDATWVYRFYPDDTRKWATTGGDYASTVSASTAVGAPGQYTWSSAQMAADVQKWLDTPATQFGWLLRENDAGETTESSAKQFDTKESGNPPVLTIDYSSAAGNLPPTLDPISDVMILEDAAQQTINLTGISAGAGENQALAVTVASGNTTLVPTPTVSYTSPNATGSLRFTPTANQSGTSQITVTVRDAGSDGIPNNADDAIFSRTFSVIVSPVNDAPTLNAISNPAAILEDAPQQTINLSGISAGPLETSQLLTVTATSSNPALIPNPTVNYTSPSNTGTLNYTPVANQSGSAVITVRVQDDGGTANGGIDFITRSFTVSVTAVNDRPTLDPLADPISISKNAPQQTVNLTGISAGPFETSQIVTVTATSSNTALIPNPAVTYTNPNSTGLIAFTPVANQSGSAVITVTVKDNGGTANGGADTLTRTFTVNVSSVNSAPTLSAIANPAAILEDAGQQSVNLSGISAGPGETQVLTVTATSSNPALIPNPAVTYTSPAATGTLRYTPAANQSGSAVITVTVKDDGGTANGGVDTTTRTFTISVTPINDQPTLNSISDPTAISQDSAQQTINLSGISAGPLETQTITITATSSNPSLIPDPTVIYTSPAATGSLRYTPVAGQFGSAVITVTVKDNGGTANGGIDTLTRTFTVQVTPSGFVNQPPTFTKGSDQTATDASGAVSVAGWATSISPGAPSEAGQTITFLVTNNNNALFAVQPTISPSGTLAFTPAPNAHGTAIVTVQLKDNGGIANGGSDTSTPQTFNITITKPRIWHNTASALDVTGDGHLTAADALAIINYVISNGTRAVPANAPYGPNYYDVNGDGYVSPYDALLVLRAIYSGAGAEGEAARSNQQATDAVFHELGRQPQAPPPARQAPMVSFMASNDIRYRSVRRRT